MLVRFFKTNQVYIYLFVFLLLLAFRWPVLVQEAPFSPAGQLPFMADFFAWLVDYPILSVLLSAAAISYQAFVLSELSNEHKLLPYSSNLAAFVLALNYSVFEAQLWFSPVICANIFQVLAIKRLMLVYQQGEYKALLFRAGIYISLASIFYLPSAFLLLVLFYDLFTIRTFQWREFVVPILAFILPFFYLWCYYFIKDESDIFLNYLIEPKSFLEIMEIRWLTWMPSIIVLIISIAAVFYLLSSINKRTVRQNNLFKVIMATFILSLIVGMLFSNDFMSSSALVWPSMTLVGSYFVLSIDRKWIQEGLIYLFILFVILRDVAFVF